MNITFKSSLSPTQLSDAALKKKLAEDRIKNHKIHIRARSFVTLDPATIKVVQNAVRIAFILDERPTDQFASILIIGPSGCGKELIARILHGDKPDGTFKTTNCAGFTDTLFESLLFGHRRGAFTGAMDDHRGMFREAGDGTLFLDEIGELPLNQQAKLLRALETRKVQPVGESQEYPFACRIVAATNKDLLKMVHNKTFREDLYFRLARIVLKVPGLSERPLDVPLIADAICTINDWTPVKEHIPESVYTLGGVRALENWLFQQELALEDDI